MTLNLRSKNIILGDLVRAFKNNTDVTSFAPGSDTAILLEAIAKSQAQIEVSSLKILENSNLESLDGQGLDKKGQSIQIPNGQGGIGRIPANQATGPVTITDSTFSKISSKLYAGKPSPFSGGTTLYVENASAFPSTGSIYIARNTVDRFEGPIPYSSVVNSGSFWTITLSSPLSKSHLLSDLVVVAQGGDRKVNARTTVQIPANSQQSAVQFQTDTQVIIPDGENQATVTVTCNQSGEIGNALAGTITAFATLPFPGATVTNPTSFQSGRSTESNEAFRVRIKNYPSTLSRGTASAIRSAVLGATDPASGRTIQSANVLEPVEPGDYARVYIDDNTGLEPTFGGQSYELLLQSASGQETDFGTAQFPITASVAIGSATGPFVLQAGMSITVNLDGLVETYTLTPSNYANLNSATAYEVVRDINAQSNLIGARTTNGGTGVVFIDLSGKGEILQVESSTWQATLGLPTSLIRPIFLYKNSNLLSFRGKTATLETRPISQWNLTSADLLNVPIVVDGVTQIFTILDSDFSSFGTSIATATITQWASVLKSKVAGVEFTVSGQILVLATWQQFSPGGSLSLPAVRSDGTAVGWIGDTKMWLPTASGGVLSAVGNAKDFQFNRFTGEVTLTSKLAKGDKLEVGSRSTRAFVNSSMSSTGLFTLDPLPTTTGNSRIVLGFDGSFAVRSVTVPAGATITPTVPDATSAPNIVRLTANNNSIWANAVVGDWLYLIKDASTVPTWATGIEGFYKIKLRGYSKYSSNQTYNSLVATTSLTTNVFCQVTQGSNLVAILQTGHGLQTGDLITVSNIGTIGGITGFNLSQTNVPVTVLNANAFTYTATSSATSTAGGQLDSVGTNVITVSQTSHPFASGALTAITTSASIGGISGTNLSVTNAPVTYLGQNAWAYRAVSASTSVASGTLTTVQYIADSWIEVEFSSPQLTAWSSLFGNPQPISSVMPYIFRSTVLPQLVDFGNAISSATVDAIVSAINSQVAGGTAVKINPTQFSVRSNDYRNQGTMGVLAVIGNASNILSVTNTSAQQAHTASVPSGDVQGAGPMPLGISLPVAGSYDTRTYIQVDKTFTDILDTNANPTIQAPTAFVTSYPTGFQEMWATGREYGLNTRVYNNQTSAPFTGIARGDGMIHALNTADTHQTSANNLNRYGNYAIRLQDLPLNENDKLVVQMNLDATDSTVSVPMYKLAQIQDINAISGGGKGQVISFRLLDPNDSNRPFFDPTSVYKSFDFTDFKVLTKSVGLYRQDTTDTALVVRSQAYGATHKFRFSIQYPQLPSQANIVVSHNNNFANGVGQQNLIVELPSGPLVASSLLSQGNYHIISTASGNLFDWRITAGMLNSASNYAVGNVLNISGNSDVAESYQITSATYKVSANPTATTTSGSNVVSVVVTAHGLQNNDLVNVNAASPIGGISSANLTRSDTPVTVVDANTFTYVAGAPATSTQSANLTSVTYGIVIVKSPGSGGLASGATFNAAQAPISTWPTATATYATIATAINAYLPQNPIASAVAIGSGASTTPVTTPTYITYPNTTPYAGTDISGAFDWNSFAAKYSGSAGIWQYDSSVASANAIKATVQTDDAIFPTTTEASGTSYSPIGESVMLVPTNSKTLSAWMNFKATSSLNLLASVERIDNDSKVQVASLNDGASGAVQITGVSANSVSSALVGNGADADNSTKITILSADAKPLMTNQVVKIQNTLSSEIQRPYRLTPTGAAITSANTININTFFRQTNSIKYIKVGTNTGRLIFYRNGMDASQTEPLQPGNTVTLTNLGNGLVRVSSAIGSGSTGSGMLSARTGDMLYIQPNSEFPVDTWGKSPNLGAGITDGTAPEYIGYPVVFVTNNNTITILAPNITTFSTTTLTSATSLVFMPAVYNEKNVRTNHAEGTKYDQVVNNNKMYYLIKKLGGGFVSLFVQNSSAEATDTMRLDDLSVSTDDSIYLGPGFNSQNQGTFKIVAHNGRNHVVFYNPAGGADEIVDQFDTSNGGVGDRKWRVGPLSDGVNRQLRVIASESVKIGDTLRISGPQANSQWFNSAFFGSWTITGIGYHAFVYSGSLPNSPGVGTVNMTKICPYIDFTLPNAPTGVVDSTGALVDSFLIGGNDSSIGFVEGAPFTAYRLVAGHGIDPSNSENSNVFLTPRINSSKMTSIYGSVLTALGKLGYDQNIHQGIDGYKVYQGLPQIAQDIIDGLPSNAVNFPGVKAAGTIVEVLTPLLRTIDLSLSVLPTEGVTLNSLSDLIKASVSAYVNSLGVGASVVVSEIIAIVQALPGVLSVTVVSTLPVANNGSIVVSSTEKALILDSSAITVG